MPKSEDRMFRVARAKKGLTQSKLADILNVTTQTIRNWEKKRSEPSLHNVIRLSMILELTLDEVILYFK